MLTALLKKEREIIMKKIASLFHAWLDNYASMTPTGVIPINK